MTFTYQSRIESVVYLKTALVLRFGHPADVRPPALTGYGLDADEMTPRCIDKICRSLVHAAKAMSLQDLVGRAVTLSVDRGGVLEAICFETDESWVAVRFADYCKT